MLNRMSDKRIPRFTRACSDEGLIAINRLINAANRYMQYKSGEAVICDDEIAATAKQKYWQSVFARPRHTSH